MNNREAITLLRNLEDSLDSYCELNEEGKTAFRMAIEALNCSEFPNNSDTISRQAAIDALTHKWDGMVTSVFDVINSLPSAQPEIIRCGECTHKDKKIDYCHYLGITICEHDYCSYAERRTDETD